MTYGEQEGCQAAAGVPDEDDRRAGVLVARDADQGPGVRHVVVPRVDAAALAVAATVPDAVERMHGVTRGGQAAGQRVVQAEVLAVAVQQHDDGAGLAVGQPRLMMDAALEPVKVGIGTSSRRWWCDQAEVER